MAVKIVALVVLAVFGFLALSGSAPMHGEGPGLTVCSGNPYWPWSEFLVPLPEGNCGCGHYFGYVKEPKDMYGKILRFFDGCS